MSTGATVASVQHDALLLHTRSVCRRSGSLQVPPPSTFAITTIVALHEVRLLLSHRRAVCLLCLLCLLCVEMSAHSRCALAQLPRLASGCHVEP